MKDALGRTAAIAGTQQGHVSRGQALEIGLSDNVISRLVRNGAWVKVHPGVYRVSGAPAGWPGRVMAACLAAGPGALASHRTAAALWGLEGFEPRRAIDLSVPAPRRPRVDDVTARRCRDLEHAAPTKREGIPVTGLVRTVLDLAGSERNPQIALRALDGARRRPHKVPWRAFEAVLETHGGRGRKGLAAYRELLERRHGVEPSDSNFESDVFDRLVAAALPLPQLQYEVLGYRLDVAWPATRVGVECQSRKFHLTEEAFENDPIRSAELGVAGWLILYVTWQQMKHPERVVDRVRRALASRVPAAAGR